MKTAGTEMQRHTHVDAHIGEMDSHRKNIKPTNEPIESCLYIYIYIYQISNMSGISIIRSRQQWDHAMQQHSRHINMTCLFLQLKKTTCDMIQSCWVRRLIGRMAVTTCRVMSPTLFWPSGRAAEGTRSENGVKQWGWNLRAPQRWATI